MKLIHGNSFDIIPKINGGPVTVITDPPYDLEYLPNFDKFIGNKIIFCSAENQFFKKCDETLFWIKTPSTKNFSKKCGRFVEMIQVIRNEKSAFNKLHWSQMIGFYDDKLIYDTLHPYEKPLTLIERLVRIYTNPGDIVIDPFMGSGTVLEACMNLGRESIGIEIDIKYFNIAQERLKKYQKNG